MASSSDPIIGSVTQGDSPLLSRAVTTNVAGVDTVVTQAMLDTITYRVFDTRGGEITTVPIDLTVADVIDDTPPTTGLLAGMNFSFQLDGATYLADGPRRRLIPVTFTLTGGQSFVRTFVLWTEHVPGQAASGTPDGSTMLATLGELVTALNLDAPSQAVLRQLDDALVQADRWVRNYCGRQFGLDTYVQEYDATSDGRLRLRQYPVSSITHVWYDWLRAFGSNTLLTADTQYRLERRGEQGFLRLLPGWGGFGWGGWGWGYGGGGYGCGGGYYGGETLRVEYVAGYADGDVPDDLSGAVIDVASSIYFEQVNRQRLITAGGAVKQLRRGQSQIAYMTAAESAVAVGTKQADPYGVNAVLDLYREMPL